MNAAAVVPQVVAADLVLAAIVGRHDGGLVELRYKKRGGPMRQEFHPATSRRAVVERAHRLSAHADVYWGVAPRVRPAGGADAVERCWVLWVDADGPEPAERLERFEPQASVIVRSGSGGAHGYWSLKDGLRPDHAVRANRRLAHALGCDMRATDAARILRVPGTKNWKHAPPAAVECIRLELDTYSARDVVGHLPDPPGAAPMARPDLRAMDGAHEADVLREVPAAEYLTRLTGRAVGRDSKLQCPWHAGGAEKTPSLHVYGTSWACFACDAPPGRQALGGDIYSFAARWYGLSTRGRDFVELRSRLVADLVGAVAA